MTGGLQADRAHERESSSWSERDEFHPRELAIFRSHGIVTQLPFPASTLFQRTEIWRSNNLSSFGQKTARDPCDNVSTDVWGCDSLRMPRPRVRMATRGPSGAALFVAYYRVSTDQQGRSGLGLDAQKATVGQYVASTTGVVVAEFQEVEFRQTPRSAATGAGFGRMPGTPRDAGHRQAGPAGARRRVPAVDRPRCRRGRPGVLRSAATAARPGRARSS